MGDFILPYAILVRHRAIAGRISRIARVADINEADGKLVATRAEGVGLSGGLDAEGEHSKEHRDNRGKQTTHAQALDHQRGFVNPQPPPIPEISRLSLPVNLLLYRRLYVIRSVPFHTGSWWSTESRTPKRFSQ